MLRKRNGLTQYNYKFHSILIENIHKIKILYYKKLISYFFTWVILVSLDLLSVRLIHTFTHILTVLEVHAGKTMTSPNNQPNFPYKNSQGLVDLYYSFWTFLDY